MDDWQETAFTSRHVHNRVGRHSGRAKGRGAFDVRKSFGTYALERGNSRKGHATSKEAPNEGNAMSTLEIYRLTEAGNGLIGEIVLAGALTATVVLTGSRSTLQTLVSEMESAQGPTMGGPRDADHTGADGASVEDEASADSAVDSEEDNTTETSQRRRFRNFEKNSFRSPKFWLQWRGHVSKDTREVPDVEDETGIGYLVFSGSDCRKFQGTISCKSLGWNNAAFSGRKEVSRSERDVPVSWIQGPRAVGAG
ncbi:catalase [Xylariaceae sp. FL0016]|nr:catalase [Xylariaceae sp. FL0016]